MSEYMDDVLQPRSRHSWDVLKAWFRVGPNDIGNGVTEESTKPAAPRRRAGSTEGEVVAATDTNADAPAVRFGERAQEELSGDAGAGAGEEETGPEQETAAAAAATPVGADVDAAEREQRQEEPSDDAGAGKGEKEAGRETAGNAGTTPAAEAGQPAAEVTQAKAATAAAAETEASEVVPTPPTCAATPALEAAAADGGVADDPVGVDGDSMDTTAANRGSTGVAGGGGSGWSVVECKVGTDGTCENCGEVLRSVDLSKDDEERLLRQVGCGAVLCLALPSLFFLFFLLEEKHLKWILIAMLRGFRRAALCFLCNYGLVLVHRKRGV